jgi:hypothetical protein
MLYFFIDETINIGHNIVNYINNNKIRNNWYILIDYYNLNNLYYIIENIKNIYYFTIILYIIIYYYNKYFKIYTLFNARIC